MAVRTQRGLRNDAGLCLVIFVGVVLYLAALPRNLGIADESYFLLEAKRILNGEVLYKDVFYWSTPVADWIMALAFGIFGVDIRTAKLLMAALHGLTAVVAFLTARRLGVRTGIALCLPIAYVALCEAPWPYASPHWFSTFLMVLLLFTLLGNGWVQRPASATLPGVVTGVLTAIQHQKGIVVAAGVCGLFALDCALSRRCGERCSARDLLRRLLYFGAGASMVIIPVILVILGTAGHSAFLDAILWTVRGGKYREYNHPRWGEVNPFAVSYARYTLPLVLKYLPILVVAGILRACQAWVARTDRAELDKTLVLTAFSATSLLSVVYYPDFIHLAFVAPVLFIFGSETLEALMRRVEPAIGYRRVSTGLVIVGLAGSLTLQLYRNMARARQEYPYPHETAFGHVDFATQDEIRLVERVRRLLREAGSHEFFAYPAYTSLYLTTGADNPTPYQFLIPGFHPPNHVERALVVLRAKKLPYIVAYHPLFFLKPDDVILNYIHRHYECVDRGQRDCVLFRRRGDDSSD